MLTTEDASSTQLSAQHVLKGEDLLQICSLAHRSLSSTATTTAEQLLEQISTFSFEQFFGFTCHLFITTDVPEVREQLAELLPKFGSIAVFSLVKIAYYFQDTTAIHRLALQSLETMPVQPLSIGLAGVIEEHSEAALMPKVVVPSLIRLIEHYGEAILLLLSQQLSTAHWQQTETQLVEALSIAHTSNFQPSNIERKSKPGYRLKIRVKNQASKPLSHAIPQSSTASSAASQPLKVAC